MADSKKPMPLDASELRHYVDAWDWRNRVNECMCDRCHATEDTLAVAIKCACGFKSGPFWAEARHAAALILAADEVRQSDANHGAEVLF